MNATPLKTIALEEHYITPAIRDANLALPPELRDPSTALQGSSDIGKQLLDLGDERIRQMDASGVDFAVLSVTTPSTQSLPPQQAIALASEANDALAQAIQRYPDRLGGFATLPTPDPQASARELERCVRLGFKGAMVNGRTCERYLDHPDFLPIFEKAVELGVPIYVHPQGPPYVVQQAHFMGFDDAVNYSLMTGGYGWHVETGINAVRMILSGLFDRLPDLQIILGHWGETIPFYLERVNTLSRVAHTLQRPVMQTFRENFYITPAGLYSVPMLLHAMATMGVDRILYSTDYPFVPAPNGLGRTFLETAPISPADQRKIGSENAARLLGIEI